ncbi:polysaccharide biosynthesis/export family protein [Nodosilinea nodulosa]|uniref:polysaccharide biosynthesis/export family protein n=1 Tax=Nodosilinea nodulosa TaxID=416001 RepID=UPI001CEDA823|nr:polysaccharide biosynthesis/export family protein [Nodosilinea nodulosa]
MSGLVGRAAAAGKLGLWSGLGAVWVVWVALPTLAQTPVPLKPTSPPDLPLRPLSPAPTGDFDAYRLGPGDSIFVGVQRFPDLSFPATLDIQGNVVVPLAGTANLAGLTLDQARDRLFSLYNQYVVNPDVSLILTAQRPVEVTVVGEVPRPGLYPLQAPQLSVALLTAGGSTTLADLRMVQVDRSLKDGSRLSQTVDLFTPLVQGDPIPQVQLQDGDVITVPRLTPEDVGSYDRDLVATSTLARPEITVRVLNRAAGARGGEARFGAINLPNGSRFLDALAVAGVNPDVAAYHRIAVLRFNPETGSADTLMVDATAAVNGDLSQNVPLQENDILVVDRNLMARVSYALNTFTQPFRDVLGFLLFFDSLTNSAESLFRP